MNEPIKGGHEASSQLVVVTVNSESKDLQSVINDLYEKLATMEKELNDLRNLTGHVHAVAIGAI